MKNIFIRLLRREPDTIFRKHIQKSNNFVTVDYLKKTSTTESHETKIRLLNLMITRLRKIYFCEKNIGQHYMHQKMHHKIG
ncbi:hypothetical protein AB4K20DRAFT_1918946 [Rhizopus microsporus]